MEDGFEDTLPFHYTGATKGASLNMVVTEPAVIKLLKAHCLKVGGHPVAIHNAQYDFAGVSGRTATRYIVDIEVAENKKKLTKAQSDKKVDRWADDLKFPWSFGIPTEEAREV